MTTNWIFIIAIALIGLFLLFRWIIKYTKETQEQFKYTNDQRLKNNPPCPVCHFPLKVKDSNFKKSGYKLVQYLKCPNCGHQVSVSRDTGMSDHDFEYIKAKIKEEPDNAYNWLAKGIAEEKLRDFSAARKSYETVIRLGWDNNVLDVQKMIEQLKRKGY
jgi:hypothetical protein